jgi:hypothetical protein
MLLTWRLKFPQPFVKYQALIKRLSAKEKNYLSSMLSTLEHPSVNLLTAELLDLILSDFDDHLSDFDDHLEGCCNLINLLAQQRSLNKKNI